MNSVVWLLVASCIGTVTLNFLLGSTTASYIVIGIYFLLIIVGYFVKLKR